MEKLKASLPILLVCFFGALIFLAETIVALFILSLLKDYQEIEFTKWNTALLVFLHGFNFCLTLCILFIKYGKFDVDIEIEKE